MKCIWALGDINTVDSRKKLEVLSQSENRIIYDAFIKSDDYLNNKDKWSISKDNKYKMTFTFK